MDFLYFLGRFHVLMVHIPIGIVVALLVLEWLARRDKYRHLQAASPFLWAAGAVSAILTVVLGYMHFAEGGFTGPSAYDHRWFGTATAVLITAVAVLRNSRFEAAYQPVYFPAAVLMFVLVSITGHFGGNLTHGSTYLIEYAPQPLRSLMGLAPRRPPVESLASADPFLDIVGPMLSQRCTGCHNPDKHESDLDLSSYEGVMHGGETGSVIAPGKPDYSELLRRISLPKDDDAFMPAEGKPPLTDDQVKIVKWWIEQGAKSDTTLGEMGAELSPEIERLIRQEVGLPADNLAAAGASG
jgi:uncharacterized membrane protein